MNQCLHILNWYGIENVLILFYKREQDTQTKQDNYSNVSKPQTFLHGLRGGGTGLPTNMLKVDLTVDVSEPKIVREFMVPGKK